MNDIELYNRLAKVEAKADSMERDMKEMRGDVKTLLALVNQTKGGWKVILLIGGISGAVGALLGKFLPFLVR